MTEKSHYLYFAHTTITLATYGNYLLSGAERPLQIRELRAYSSLV